MNVQKCGHCGSRDCLVLAHHSVCLECGGFTDADGKPIEQPSDHAFPA